TSLFDPLYGLRVRRSCCQDIFTTAINWLEPIISNQHFPDGRSPSPSLGLDTAFVTSQARLHRVLALLDVLLRRAAPVVEGDDRLRRATQVRDDEADARVQLPGMPLHLRDDPARSTPALRLVAEARVKALRSWDGRLRLTLCSGTQQALPSMRMAASHS